MNRHTQYDYEYYQFEYIASCAITIKQWGSHYLPTSSPLLRR